MSECVELLRLLADISLFFQYHAADACSTSSNYSRRRKLLYCYCFPSQSEIK